LPIISSHYKTMPKPMVTRKGRFSLAKATYLFGMLI
jgi:hypothetical protein